MTSKVQEQVIRDEQEIENGNGILSKIVTAACLICSFTAVFFQVIYITSLICNPK